MSLLAERLREYDGLSRRQIGELYQQNFKKLKSYLHVDPRRYRECLQIERDLERISRRLRDDHQTLWKTSEHFRND